MGESKKDMKSKSLIYYAQIFGLKFIRNFVKKWLYFPHSLLYLYTNKYLFTNRFFCLYNWYGFWRFLWCVCFRIYSISPCISEFSGYKLEKQSLGNLTKQKSIGRFFRSSQDQWGGWRLEIGRNQQTPKRFLKHLLQNVCWTPPLETVDSIPIASAPPVPLAPISHAQGHVLTPWL